jgi:predicted nucleotidyltransferase
MRSVGQRGETPPELDDDALRTALADCRLSLVVLVGSYATGSAQPLSDLDISVRFEDTVPRARRQGLLDEVAVAIQLATGIDAGDLVDLKPVSPAVGYEALARGMRLTDDRAEATAPET